MSSVSDIVVSLAINGITSVVLVGVYAILKNQPVNNRVYYSKWVARGEIMGPQPAEIKGMRIGRYLNLNLKTYVHVMDWIRSSLRMPEKDLIKHAGLDSAVYLRMILLGMKIFLPMMVYGFVVLVPINVTDTAWSRMQSADSKITYSALDTITLSNIQNKSPRLWAHIIAAYMYTAWTCYLLFQLYRSLVDLRFEFLAEQERAADQFTVLCRCIPPDPDESVKQHVEHFFRVNHPDYYLLSSVVYNANALSKLVKKKANLQNKISYLQSLIVRRPLAARPTTRKRFGGCWGERVDKLDFLKEKMDVLTEQIHSERFKVLNDDKYVMTAAFVSFKTRWAAAVCAQTTQSRDSSMWLTDWAPESRDVYWANLPIPYNQSKSRRLVTLLLLAVMVVFFLIPVGFVQSLANLDKVEKKVGFLKPLIEWGFLKSVLQGFLPGLILKIFLVILPFVLLLMSSFEGHVSFSTIERHAAMHYLAFMLVNVFLGNVITGTALDQIRSFLENPTKIPDLLGENIPQRATFFITYIMVDGWTNCAIDLIRLWPFIIYHFRNATMVRTETDRDRATPVGFIMYTVALSRLGLYFLLGFVYSTISPLILPFILIFLAAAYLVYRNHIIHAYEQRYESNGQLWPVMFAYVIIGLLVMHATLIGLMALKEAEKSTPFLAPLPCCTIVFWYYCQRRFAESFRCFPLEEAKAKDNLESVEEPDIDHREFLETAYMHPALRAPLTGAGDLTESDSEAVVDELKHKPVVATYKSGEENSSTGSSTAKVRADRRRDQESQLEVRSPLGARSPLNVQSPYGGQGPFEARSPYQARSPHNAQSHHGVQSPFEARSPHNAQSHPGVQSPFEARSPYQARSPHDTRSHHGGQSPFEARSPRETHTSRKAHSPRKAQSHHGVRRLYDIEGT